MQGLGENLDAIEELISDMRKDRDLMDAGAKPYLDDLELHASAAAHSTKEPLGALAPLGSWEPDAHRLYQDTAETGVSQVLMTGGNGEQRRQRAINSPTRLLEELNKTKDQVRQLSLVLSDIVEGWDSKAVTINGPLIEGEPDVMWKWEDEWLHHARSALDAAKDVE